MAVMTAQELADHAQDAFENNLMDDPTPYEMGMAWKSVGESLFEILAERAKEEQAPEIAYLVNQLDAIRRDNWLTMSFEKQDALDAAADTLNRQAAEIKQLREVLADLVGYVEVNFDSPIDEIALIAPRAVLTGEEQ